MRRASASELMKGVDGRWQAVRPEATDVPGRVDEAHARRPSSARVTMWP
jgi:hypothetical protein